jgi:hypothetical protein
MLLRSGFEYFYQDLTPNTLVKHVWKNRTVAVSRQYQKRLWRAKVALPPSRRSRNPRISRLQLQCARDFKNTIQDQTKRHGSWAHRTREWATVALARRYVSAGMWSATHSRPSGLTGQHDLNVQFRTVRINYAWKSGVLPWTGWITNLTGKCVDIFSEAQSEWECVDLIPWRPDFSALREEVAHSGFCLCRLCQPTSLNYAEMDFLWIDLKRIYPEDFVREVYGSSDCRRVCDCESGSRSVERGFNIGPSYVIGEDGGLERYVSGHSYPNFEPCCIQFLVWLTARCRNQAGRLNS